MTGPQQYDDPIGDGGAKVLQALAVLATVGEAAARFAVMGAQNRAARAEQHNRVEGTVDRARTQADLVAKRAASAQRQADRRLMDKAFDDAWLAGADIAEVGIDMTRFPTPRTCPRGARFAPKVKESAGRKKGTSATGHGNPYLARTLGHVAASAGRTQTFLGERYRRIRRRRGPQRAIVAVGRSALVIIGTCYPTPPPPTRISESRSTTPASTRTPSPPPHPPTRSPRLRRHRHPHPARRRINGPTIEGQEPCPAPRDC